MDRARTGWFLLASLGLHTILAALFIVRPKPAPAVLLPPPLPSAALAGDSFEVPAILPGAAAVDDAPPKPGAPPPPSPQGGERRTRRAPLPVAAAASGEVGNGDAGPTAPTVFGAVGVAYASDLVSTFTKTFPQTAYNEPGWGKAAAGAIGGATVAIEIDAAGQMVSSHIDGTPLLVLRAAIERTLLALNWHKFTASGPVTRMKIEGKLIDGVADDVFALHHELPTNGKGTASIAFGNGRRLELTLRILP